MDGIANNTNKSSSFVYSLTIDLLDNKNDETSWACNKVKNESSLAQANEDNFRNLLSATKDKALGLKKNSFSTRC